MPDMAIATNSSITVKPWFGFFVLGFMILVSSPSLYVLTALPRFWVKKANPLKVPYSSYDK